MFFVRFLAFCDLKNQEFEAFSENLQSFSFWANRKIKYIFFVDGNKNKNIKKLCGYPLIAWTILTARKSKYIKHNS